MTTLAIRKTKVMLLSSFVACLLALEPNLPPKATHGRFGLLDHQRLFHYNDLVEPKGGIVSIS